MKRPEETDEAWRLDRIRNLCVDVIRWSDGTDEQVGLGKFGRRMLETIYDITTEHER